MRLSERGGEAIKRYEGCPLVAYRCPAGVLTIGYGHTGKDVTPGLRITQARADELFLDDIERFERGVREAVRVPISQGQFDALVSFAFNVGLGALNNSTLLRKLNAGDHAGAACQFARWNKIGRVYNEGLALRRAGELYTFARGCP